MTTEQFKKFKQVWANAVNSPKASSQLIQCDELLKIDPRDNPKTSHLTKYQNTSIRRNNGYYICTNTGNYKKDGWIQKEHFLLYNIICNKPVENGFNKIVNIKKRKHLLVNNGLYVAYLELKRNVAFARTIIRDDDNPNDVSFEKYNNLDNLKKIKHQCFGVKALIEFIEPLSDAINIETIYNLNIPQIVPNYE